MICDNCPNPAKFEFWNIRLCAECLDRLNKEKKELEK